MIKFSLPVWQCYCNFRTGLTEPLEKLLYFSLHFHQESDLNRGKSVQSRREPCCKFAQFTITCTDEMPSKFITILTLNIWTSQFLTIVLKFEQFNLTTCLSVRTAHVANRVDPIQTMHSAVSVCVLRFYGPVNPMESWAQSVYLTTHLLGRLSPLSS